MALQGVVRSHAHAVVDWIKTLEESPDSEDCLAEENKHLGLPDVLAALVFFLVVLSSQEDFHDGL